jgi:hypothetical protein
MGKRESGPICRVMTRWDDGVATLSVFGPNRTMIWWAVHATAPTIVRLWPHVVRFMRDALDELSDSTNQTTAWRLPYKVAEYNPEIAVFRVKDGHPWLYVFAASPSAVRLTPARVSFLREALADLPPQRRQASAAQHPRRLVRTDHAPVAGAS